MLSFAEDEWNELLPNDFCYKQVKTKNTKNAKETKEKKKISPGNR